MHTDNGRAKNGLKVSSVFIPHVSVVPEKVFKPYATRMDWMHTDKGRICGEK